MAPSHPPVRSQQIEQAKGQHDDQGGDGSGQTAKEACESLHTGGFGQRQDIGGQGETCPHEQGTQGEDRPEYQYSGRRWALLVDPEDRINGRFDGCQQQHRGYRQPANSGHGHTSGIVDEVVEVFLDRTDGFGKEVFENKVLDLLFHVAEYGKGGKHGESQRRQGNQGQQGRIAQRRRDPGTLILEKPAPCIPGYGPGVLKSGFYFRFRIQARYSRN